MLIAPVYNASSSKGQTIPVPAKKGFFAHLMVSMNVHGYLPVIKRN
jgi:hypothetical protein